VHQSCGPPEVGKALLVECNWTKHLDHVPTAMACRESCSTTAICKSWTWVKDAGLHGPGAPSQCVLLGGAPSQELPNDGVISGRCGRQTPAAPRVAAPAPQTEPTDSEDDNLPKPDLHAPPEQANENWHPSCAGGPLPALPMANVAGEPLAVKILTYNLYWWHLFDVGKSFGGRPFRLLNGSMSPPYDVMGFQECEDPNYVLQQAGLADKYQAFAGENAICMAFRKDTWTMLSAGQANVAEDRRDQYFGKRAAQWVRLRHNRLRKVLFFMNHHGPTPVDTGGYCLGPSTALHLMQLAASHTKPGDAVVMAGDFNAGPSSATVALLRQRLDMLFSGSVDGGIDHIFSNMQASSVLHSANLGNGGSDHDALQVLLRISGPGAAARPSASPTPPSPPRSGPAPPAPPKQPKPGAPAAAPGAHPTAGPAARPAAGPALQAGKATAAPPAKPAECRIEPNTDYVIESDWGFHFDHVPSPSICCSRCSIVPECKAWIWVPAEGLNQCWLKGGLPVARVVKPGFIAGLPNHEAGALHPDAAETAALERYGALEMAKRKNSDGTPAAGAHAPPPPEPDSTVVFLSSHSESGPPKAAHS